VTAVHAGYKKYRKQLLAAGISLFELKPTAKNLLSKTGKILEGSKQASLHAKYMVVDRQYVFIGSANLDPRSGLLNTEIGIMIDSPQLAEKTIELFNRSVSLENSYHVLLDKAGNKLSWLTRKDDKEITFFQEPEVGFFRKLAVFIISLLPIENLL